MKPLPTLMRPLASVDLATGEPAEALVERSDVAAVEALAVVAEAAVAWELARAAREKFGGDALARLRRRPPRVPGADRLEHALDRHIALIGFMGAGKTTLGAALAELLGRPFVDVDAEIEARGEDLDRRHVPTTRARRGSARSRRRRSARRCARREPAVIALGGGALGARGDAGAAPRRARSRSWSRSTSTSPGSAPRGSDRPARPRRGEFRALYDERLPVYDERRRRASRATWTSRARGRRGPRRRRRARAARRARPRRRPGRARRRPARRRDPRRRRAARARRPARLDARASAPARRRRRVAGCERLWSELRARPRGHRSSRSAAAARPTSPASPPPPTCAASRGCRCRPRSSARSTRRSAARPRLDLAGGKNLVGAFHWPARVVIDPTLLATLPATERARGHGRGREDGPARRARRSGSCRTRRSCAAAPPSRPPSACATRRAAAERAVAQPRPHLRARARGRGAATRS